MSRRRRTPTEDSTSTTWATAAATSPKTSALATVVKGLTDLSRTATTTFSTVSVAWAGQSPEEAPPAEVMGERLPSVRRVQSLASPIRGTWARRRRPGGSGHQEGHADSSRTRMGPDDGPDVGEDRVLAWEDVGHHRLQVFD